MTTPPTPKDLIILVADADMEFALHALLSRPKPLCIREVSFQVHRHPQRDAGCRTDCHDFLRPFLHDFGHALVLFDLEGCGQEESGRDILEADVTHKLDINGWCGRCSVIVITPELESWVWSESPEVDSVLGWKGGSPRLREWVRSATSFWRSGNEKPEKPKEALEAALQKAGKHPSAALYQELAARVSFKRCIDPAFLKLKCVLQNWFSPVAN